MTGVDRVSDDDYDQQFGLAMPDNRLLMVDEYVVAVLDLATMRRKRIARMTAERTVKSMSAHADGTTIALGDDQGYVSVFDADSGILLFEIRCSAGWVTNVEFVGDDLICISDESGGGTAIRRFRLTAPDVAASRAQIERLIAARTALGDFADLPLDLDRAELPAGKP